MPLMPAMSSSVICMDSVNIRVGLDFILQTWIPCMCHINVSYAEMLVISNNISISEVVNQLNL